jgi:hypothetical protein
MGARRLLPILLAARVAAPGASYGQTPNERSVRAVVDSFFAAVSAEKWDSAATFLDLSRFEPYFTQVVSNARTALPPPPITVEALMASDSTMPRAVAEWQIDRMKNYPMPQFGDMSHEFAGVRTQRDLFALTVPQAAARWLEAKDERTSMRESFRRSGCALSELPAFPPSKHTVIGVAVIDDSTVYAIQRDDRFRGEDLNAPQSERVIPVHRTRGRWLIEPRGDLLRPFNGGIWYGVSCPKNKR